MTTILNKQKKNINTAAINKPEIQLLLCCARTKIDRATSDRLKKLVRQNIDWQYLIDVAARHGVLPLLFDSLNNICSDAVPKNILSSLRSYFQANAVRNLSLSAELLSILNIF